MSKLIKCDRCGYVFPPGPGYEEKTLPTDKTRKRDWCYDCNESLKDIVREWWKDVEQQ